MIGTFHYNLKHLLELVNKEVSGLDQQVPAVAMRNITKTFNSGAVVANKDVSINVFRGEILALLGENGSGKTTLMNMLSGIYFPDDGQIFVDGKEVVIRSPKDALDLGIGMIHQHFKLVDVLTATENIILGLKEEGRLDLKAAADRSSRWADKNEGTKIGFDPVKEHDRDISTRPKIGAKTKKMQSRVKAFEKRMDREIREKEGLLQDIERVPDLKLCPMRYHKDILIHADHFSLQYADAKDPLFTELRFQIRNGDRTVLAGDNGCGKTSILKMILEKAGVKQPGTHVEGAQAGRAGCNDETGSGLQAGGTLEVGAGLVISYINQDTSWLKGAVEDFCEDNNLDKSMFCSMLRHLGFERAQFEKDISEYSQGQKKKVLLASSLLTPAHLYIWDEPLNFIDIFSRMQIEKLLLEYQPTMLFVEHDEMFRKKIATETVCL